MEKEEEKKKEGENVLRKMSRRVPYPTGLTQLSLNSSGSHFSLPQQSPTAQVARSTAVSRGSVGISPTRASRATGTFSYRNSSDGVAEVLGGSPSRQRPPMPLSRPTTHHAPREALEQPAVPTAAQQSLQYDCKVLMSSGRTGTQPIVLSYGVGAVQGFRPTMEDAHVVKAGKAGDDAVMLFAILDGHCGRHVADLGAQMLPGFVLSHAALGQNNALALVDSIIQTDQAIFQQIGRSDGGSTLICALVHKQMLFVACLGDARAVVCDGNEAMAMSQDHKPTDVGELQRITRCGGFVQFGRVAGCLAVSRALGDYEFKLNGTRFVQHEFVVSNVADVRQINITDATRFIILACDGLWDVYTNEDAVQFVSSYLSRSTQPGTLTQCATQLANHAIDKGSMDNVSVMIVLFHEPPKGRDPPTPTASVGSASINRGTPPSPSKSVTPSSRGRY